MSFMLSCHWSDDEAGKSPAAFMSDNAVQLIAERGQRKGCEERAAATMTSKGGKKKWP